MVVEAPRLLFESRLRRRPHVRRTLWSLLAALSGLTLVFAFEYVSTRIVIPIELLDLGKLVSLGIFAVFGVRAIFAFGRALRTKTESFKFFDRGFVWQRGKQTYKYSYAQLASWREDYRAGRLGQRGAIVFKTTDGQTFKIRPIHGNLRRFAHVLRPYLTDIFGSRMGRALREGRTIRVHPNLMLAPKGIKVGKQAVRWQDVDVRVQRGRLNVSRRDGSGRFVSVGSFRTRDIENLNGFVDVAQGVIQNYQPQRFGIETQVGKVIRTPTRKP